MPKSANEVWRDFVRFTGDGLPNEPVGHGLPTGDPSSGEHSPKKWEIRDWAGGMQISLDRAEDAADLAMQAALDVQGASLYAANVASLLANTATSFPTGTIFATREEGYSFRVAAPSATDHDAVTAGGVKLYRLRRKRVMLAYSQSNFANRADGVAWKNPPPANLFVWNGGNWNGNSNATQGTAFVPASTMAPQVPVAYAAEIARTLPEDDVYLIIIARGGTGITALTGIPYVFDSATSGAPAPGHLRLSAGNGQLIFSETDALGKVRFVGTTDLGTDPFYPGRVQINSNPNAYLSFTSTVAATDQGDYRTQPLTPGASASWPPADGTMVRLYTQLPRMWDIMRDNLQAAFTAINLTGADRKLDHLFLWPPESDLNYSTAYAADDLPYLMNLLSTYVTPATTETYTLPHPYGTGIGKPREDWWDVIRNWVAADSSRRSLVSLSSTGAASWGDANNIHVMNPAREDIGTFIAKSVASGASMTYSLGSGTYTPTLSAAVNVANLTAYQMMWQRVGNVVTVSGLVQVQPSTGSGDTQARISLPQASDLGFAYQLSGVAVADTTPDHCAYLQADTTNDAAVLRFTARSALAINWRVQFTYLIRPA